MLNYIKYIFSKINEILSEVFNFDSEYFDWFDDEDDDNDEDD